MWNVDPEILCQKHLFGEHVEMHMFLGCIKKGTSLKGYIDKGLVEVNNIKKRHDDLKNEIIKRGYLHKSPLELNDIILWDIGCVNSEQNINELYNRCEKCRSRIIRLKNER